MDPSVQQQNTLLFYSNETWWRNYPCRLHSVRSSRFMMKVLRNHWKMVTKMGQNDCNANGRQACRKNITSHYLPGSLGTQDFHFVNARERSRSTVIKPAPPSSQLTTALRLQKDSMDRSKQKGLSNGNNGISWNSTITSSPALSVCCSVGIWPTGKGFQSYGKSQSQTAASFPKQAVGTADLMGGHKQLLTHRHAPTQNHPARSQAYSR